MPKNAGGVAPGGPGGKFVKSGDAVADDRNWISRIQNELHCTSAWHKDWGFLEGGTENLQVENANQVFSIDDQIEQIQQEMEQIGKPHFEQSSQLIGNGSDIQAFKDSQNNIIQGQDLQPQPRSLKPDWKQDTQWKPPADEFDPLKNLFKKKQ